MRTEPFGIVGPVTVTIFAFLMAYVWAQRTAGQARSSIKAIGRITGLVIRAYLPRLSLQVEFAIEVDLPIDERFLDDGIRAKRMRGEESQISILTDIDAADSFIDSQLNRRIQRDHFE